MRELRLGGEAGADRDTVAAGDQLAGLIPDLEGMRETGIEGLRIERA